MELTEEQAAELISTIERKLRSVEAADIVRGIEEGRQLGVEETLDIRPAGPQEYRVPQSELKSLGTKRRRPPTNVEVLSMILERLHQRLVVIPKIAASIHNGIEMTNVTWRVDTEFVSSDNLPEVTLKELIPEGVEEIAKIFSKVEDLVPNIAPSRVLVRTNG